MSLSTASLIMAYVATPAVQAAPIDNSEGGLSLRSIEITSVQVARSADPAFEIEARGDEK